MMMQDPDSAAAAQPARASTPRQRARAATIEQAKRIALAQLAQGGVEAVSLKAIALQLGLTGPAIYRYFANRSELLTDLIVDAYDDLGAAVAEAAQGATRRSTTRQMHTVADAYREWALAQPHRYRLLYAAPVPGYDPNAERLVDAAVRAFSTLLNLQAGSGPARELALTRQLSKQLYGWAMRHEQDIDAPETVYRALITWTRLHGFVSLEIEGAFGSMDIDPDAVFKREVDALAGL